MAEPVLGEIRLQTVQERPQLPIWGDDTFGMPVTATTTVEVIYDGSQWRKLAEIQPLLSDSSLRSLIPLWFRLLDKVKAHQTITHEEMCSIPAYWRRDLVKRMILQR